MDGKKISLIKMSIETSHLNLNQTIGVKCSERVCGTKLFDNFNSFLRCVWHCFCIAYVSVRIFFSVVRKVVEKVKKFVLLRPYVYYVYRSVFVVKFLEPIRGN